MTVRMSEKDIYGLIRGKKITMYCSALNIRHESSVGRVDTTEAIMGVSDKKLTTLTNIGSRTFKVSYFANGEIVWTPIECSTLGR